MKYEHLFLTCSIWPFKCHFSAAAGTLFSLNAHHGAVSHSHVIKVNIVVCSKILLFEGDFFTEELLASQEGFCYLDFVVWR